MCELWKAVLPPWACRPAAQHHLQAPLQRPPPTHPPDATPAECADATPGRPVAPGCGPVPGSGGGPTGSQGTDEGGRSGHGSGALGATLHLRCPPLLLRKPRALLLAALKTSPLLPFFLYRYCRMLLDTSSQPWPWTRRTARQLQGCRPAAPSWRRWQRHGVLRLLLRATSGRRRRRRSGSSPEASVGQQSAQHSFCLFLGACWYSL